jgi:hypothetical protein
MVLMRAFHLNSGVFTRYIHVVSISAKDRSFPDNHLGGVVTFTPQAIIDNTADVWDKIREVKDHPLWICYILPSVLGVVAKVSCKENDPVEIFDR